MRKGASLSCFLFLIANICLGQRFSHDQKQYQLTEMGDTYVVRITFDTVVYQDKCYCSFPQRGVCQLFRGKVEKIYLAPEGTAFDKEQLRNVVYFTVNATFNVLPNIAYTVSLMPGSSGRYLIVNKVLNVDDPAHYVFVSPETFMSGYSSCYKLGFFTKLFIRTGLLKIGKVNAKTKTKRLDPFDAFLRKPGHNTPKSKPLTEHAL